MNLAVIDTKTNKVAVYAGKRLIHGATFDRPLFADEIEAMRLDPVKFLTEIGALDPAGEPQIA